MFSGSKSEKSIKYWKRAVTSIENYSSRTKKLLNNEYYGGCVNHGSYQPYITCKKNNLNMPITDKMCIKTER